MIRTVAFTMSKLPTGETKTINAFIEKLVVLTVALKLKISKVDQDYHGHRGAKQTCEPIYVCASTQRNGPMRRPNRKRAS